jgi:hypothetical protein
MDIYSIMNKTSIIVHSSIDDIVCEESKVNQNSKQYRGLTSSTYLSKHHNL